MIRTRMFIIAAGTAALAAVGCQHIGNAPPLTLSPSTMPVDEAMQARDWEPVTIKYANGSTVAGTTGAMYESKQQYPNQNIAQDTPLFLGNVVLMPYTFFNTPPWKPVVWRGDMVEPTYTATPPLPE